MTPYDKWRLSNTDDIKQPYIGSKDGDLCNRYPEPDEDQPRGYKPKPCAGAMEARQEGAEYYETKWIECDTCGATP